VTTPAQELFGDRYPTVRRYADILAGRGVEWGLIGPREGGRLWERHIMNSVAVSDLIPDGASLVDVGSGAGLPGIPLAILRPDLRVTLLEPLLRRSRFLTEAVDELGIGHRVKVRRSRAEDHHETYDAVVARALAPLERLVTWCAPLRSSDGLILAIKGSSAAAEVEAAAHTLAGYDLEATVMVTRARRGSEPTTVVRLTSSQLPRRPAASQRRSASPDAYGGGSSKPLKGVRWDRGPLWSSTSHPAWGGRGA
jgi:16S rRNA (guanine527-N7)-methyltransferase